MNQQVSVRGLVFNHHGVVSFTGIHHVVAQTCHQILVRSTALKGVGKIGEDEVANPREAVVEVRFGAVFGDVIEVALPRLAHFDTDAVGQFVGAEIQGVLTTSHVVNALFADTAGVKQLVQIVAREIGGDGRTPNPLDVFQVVGFNVLGKFNAVFFVSGVDGVLAILETCRRGILNGFLVGTGFVDLVIVGIRTQGCDAVITVVFTHCRAAVVHPVRALAAVHIKRSTGQKGHIVPGAEIYVIAGSDL